MLPSGNVIFSVLRPADSLGRSTSGIWVLTTTSLPFMSGRSMTSTSVLSRIRSLGRSDSARRYPRSSSTPSIFGTLALFLKPKDGSCMPLSRLDDFSCAVSSVRNSQSGTSNPGRDSFGHLNPGLGLYVVFSDPSGSFASFVTALDTFGSTSSAFPTYF